MAELDIEKINIQIEAECNNAVKGLESLTGALNSLKSVTESGLTGLNSIVTGINSICSAIDKIDVKKLTALADTLKGLKGVSSKLLSRSVKQKSTNPFLGMTPDQIEQELKLHETLRSQGLYTETTEEEDKYYAAYAQAKYEQLASEEQNAATQSHALSGALSSLKETLIGSGNEALKSSKKWGQFTKSIGNIAFYRLVRGAIKEIISVMKESIQTYAQYSDSFNDTMSNITSELSQLKNALGSAIGPLIEGLEPAILAVCDALIYAVNGFSYFSAMLSGSDSVTIATRQQKDYRDSLEDTKKSLLGFDQINTLGDNTTDYSTMYETIELSDVAIGDMIGGMTTFVGIVGTLVALFTKGSFLSGLEKVAGVFLVIEGLIETINAINAEWTSETVYENVENLLEGIGLTLTGLSLTLTGIASTITGCIGSVLLLTSGVKDLVENGMSFENVVEIVAGFAALCVVLYKIIKTAIAGTSTGLATVSVALVSILAFVEALLTYINNFADMAMWQKIVGGICLVIAAVATLCALIFAVKGNYVFAGIATAVGVAAGIGTIVVASFADGGFPDEGQLFIANEAGPELVGTLGGHTSVANNDQIVEGIKQGVMEALAESSLGGGDVTVQFVQDGQIKASRIVTAAQRKNQRDGKVVMEVNT